jgi:hypothetical protein
MEGEGQNPRLSLQGTQGQGRGSPRRLKTLRDWEPFNANTGKDSAREIREYFIPDFSNWKNHDSHQEALQRLVGDLKASDAKTEVSY